MTLSPKPIVLASWCLALACLSLDASADDPMRHSSGPRSAPTPRPPVLIAPDLPEARELARLTGEMNKSLKAVHTAMEEWGTMMLSGLLLAPPVSGGAPTFGVDIAGTKRLDGTNEAKSYDFAHWFEESGKAEGSAQFSERIFNSLIASGTLQLAPEQAALAEAFTRKQHVDKQLFQEQLERNQTQRESQLQNFRQSRVEATEARQVRINAARADVDRAQAARTEAERTRTAAAEKRTAAEKALLMATDARDRTPASEDLQKTVDARQAEADQAQGAFAAADSNLRSRTAEEKTAQDALAGALEAGISTGTLPGSAVTTPDSSPTFGKTSFQFAKEGTPGESFTAAREFTERVTPPTEENGQVTNVKNLGDDEVPSLLGRKNDADPEAAFPARARLIDAAGNQTIARIFDFLGDPSAALQFQDKPIAMAAGTIAVNPGWRTAQDYDGQIDVSAAYSWGRARRETCEAMTKAGGLFSPDEIRVARHFAQEGVWSAAGPFAYTGKAETLKASKEAPLAAAVSPLMERQNIDQASSRSRQTEIALFLSASLAKSGQKGAADVFDKFVKMRRLDVKTRSALPVVNSYGLGGGRFGFNVTSRLQAIGDVNKGKAAKVLEKQNFPILVIFGFSGEDIRPRLVYNAESNAAEIWEPTLYMIQTHRWGRQRKRGDLHQGLRNVFFPGFPGRPMEIPQQAYDLMVQAIDRRDAFAGFLSQHRELKKSATVEEFGKVFEEKYQVLNQGGFGTVTELAIPMQYLIGPARAASSPAGRTAITEVFPSRLVPRAAADGTFEAEVVVVGQNLDSVDPSKITAVPGAITVAGMPLPPGISGKQALALRFTFANTAAANGSFQLTLPVGPPGANGFQPQIWSPMITVSKETAGLVSLTPRLELPKAGQQTIELVVKANGITPEEMAQAVVEVADGGGAQWGAPKISRVHRSNKDPGQYLVEIIADVPANFVDGALRLRLRPTSLLTQQSEAAGDLRSSEFRVHVR